MPARFGQGERKIAEDDEGCLSNPIIQKVDSCPYEQITGVTGNLRTTSSSDCAQKVGQRRFGTSARSLKLCPLQPTSYDGLDLYNRQMCVGFWNFRLCIFEEYPILLIGASDWRTPFYILILPDV